MRAGFAFLFLFFTIFFTACQQSGKSQENEQPAEAETSRAPAGQLSTPGSITVEEMKKIYDDCDYIDVIFYASSFSMSQTSTSGIRQTIQFVSPRPATINADCQPIGRISFMIQGSIETEADIYMSEGCNYFVFLDDGEVYAANEMTPQGIQLFTRFLNAEAPSNG